MTESPGMTNHVMSEHSGAVEWLARQGIVAEALPWMALSQVRRGHVLYGTLPAHRIGEAIAAGCTYVHLAIDAPSAFLGRSLTADEMQAFGTSLLEVDAAVIRQHQPQQHQPRPRPGGIRNTLRGGLASILRVNDQAQQALTRWISKSKTRILLSFSLCGAIVLALPPAFLGVAWDFVTSIFRYDPGKGLDWASLAIAAACLIAYTLPLYILSNIAGMVLGSRMVPLQTYEDKCLALVMGLSPIKENRRTAAKERAEAVADRILKHFKGQPDIYAKNSDCFESYAMGLPDDMRAEVAALGLVAWQQSVRAVFYHRERLKRIQVLPSKESSDHWPAFQRMMEGLFPGIKIELVTAKGRPFGLARRDGTEDRAYENYDYVKLGFEQAIENARSRFAEDGTELKPEDICVDVTAGQKISSIAGAIVTVNRRIKLSYVTNEGKVMMFNAEINTADSLARTLN